MITVRRSYAGPTKNGEIRRVPIVDALLPILKAWRLQCPGDLVFPTAKGTLRHGSDRSCQEVLQRVLRRAEFPTVLGGGCPRHYLTFHGLRHTFASHWMMNGGDRFALQLVSRRRIPHVRIGSRLVRFDRATVDAWVQAAVVAPALPEGAGDE